jgi:hypothetical protein
MRAGVTYETNQQFGVHHEEEYKAVIENNGPRIHISFYFLKKALSCSQNTLVKDMHIGFSRSEAEKLFNALDTFLHDPTKQGEPVKWENKKEK